MPFDAGTMTTRLTLDNSQFSHALRESGASAQGFAGQVGAMGGGLEGLAAALGPVGIAAAAVVGVLGAVAAAAYKAGSALASMVQSVADAQDNLRDMATDLGVGVSFLDALGKAGELAGTNTEGVADAIRFLSRNAADAAGGGKGAAEAFARLGVSVTDAAGKIKPVEQLTWDVIDAFHAMPEGAQKTQTAMDLLGRSGARVAAFFSQGQGDIRAYMAQLERYGAVTSEAAAAQADAWNDARAEIGHAWEGIKQQLSEGVLAHALPLMNALLEWVRDHPQEMRSIVEGVIVGINAAIDLLVSGVQLLIEVLRDLAKVWALFSDDGQKAVDALDKIDAGLEKAKAQAAKASEAIKSGFRGGGGDAAGPYRALENTVGPSNYGHTAPGKIELPKPDTAAFDQAARKAEEVRRSYADAARAINEATDRLARSSAGAATATTRAAVAGAQGASASAGGEGQRGGVNIQTLNLPKFDTNAATSTIAGIIRTHLDQKLSELRQGMESAASKATLRANLGTA